MAWLHRSSLRTPVANDFDAANGFVALAEQDMNERLRARCMIVRTFQVVDQQYLVLPCDYVEMFDMRMQGGPSLHHASRDETADAAWQRNTNSPPPNNLAGMGPDFYPIVNPPAYPWGDGMPRRFSIVGSEIEFSPYPAAWDPTTTPEPPVYPIVEMAYYQRLTLGMLDTDTNAVLSTYPACYLYGSLIQSAPFLRDDSRVETWTNLYNNAVAGANAEAERSRTQGSRLVQHFRRLA